MKRLSIIIIILILFLGVVTSGDLTFTTPDTEDTLITKGASELVLNINDFPVGWNLHNEGIKENRYYNRYFINTEVSIYYPDILECEVKVYPTIEEAQQAYSDGKTTVTETHSVSDPKIGDESFLAFVEFSRHMSFGIPKSYHFTDFAIQPSSENYERITIHKDGKIRMHFPLAQNFRAPWDRQYPPLAKWDRSWSMREDLYWGVSYLPFIQNYLAKPKLDRHDVLGIQLSFPPGVEETVIHFAVMQPQHAQSTQIRQIVGLTDPTWILADAWPNVLVSIANVITEQRLIWLNSVGRDYRV